MDSGQVNACVVPISGGRLFFWIVLFFIVSLLLGAVLAGPVFNGVLWLGRNVQALERLRDVEFERVASRCVLIAFLIFLVPMVRLAGIRDWRGIGFLPDRNWWKRIGWGLLVGCVVPAVIFAGGWISGAYGIREVLERGAVGKTLGYLFGALLVGWIEEGLFRGLLFGALRRSVGFWAGATIVSGIYSAVHFAKPRPVVGPVYGHWYSGLDLIPQMFNTVNFDPHFFPFALTLFFLGMVLCAFYQRTGSLYFSIGLHAGLVWVMRVGGYFFERNDAQWPWLFGADDVIAKSYIALFVLGAFMMISLWMCRGRTRERG